MALHGAVDTDKAISLVLKSLTWTSYQFLDISPAALYKAIS
jgi:hypothetical protein